MCEPEGPKGHLEVFQWGVLLVFWGHLLHRTSPGLAFPGPHGPVFTTVLGRRTTDSGSILILQLAKLRQRDEMTFPFHPGSYKAELGLKSRSDSEASELF